MTDNITLPRSVLEQALEALDEADLLMEHRQNIELRRSALVALRAALEQPDIEIPASVPEGWKLVPVEPTDDMLYDIQEYSHILPPRGRRIWAHTLAAAPQPPAGEKTQPEIDHAHELRRHSRKLGEPVGETAGVMQRAADEIERLRAMLAAASQPKLYPLPDDLYGGSKYWRAGSYAERVEWLHLMYEGAKEEIERLEQPQVEQEPFTVLVRKHSWLDSHWEAAPSGSPDYGKQWADERINVYIHPQNLNCKSNQARLATLWGYEKPQPPRQPLTEDGIKQAFLAAGLFEAGDELVGYEVDIARAIERAHGIGGEK